MEYKFSIDWHKPGPYGVTAYSARVSCKIGNTTIFRSMKGGVINDCVKFDSSKKIVEKNIYSFLKLKLDDQITDLKKNLKG